MPADNFWDLLATEFRELGKRWPPLVAEWNAVASDAAGGRWRFYPDNIANAELREHFEHLATRAAVALELAPSAIPHPRRHCPSWDADLARARIDDAVANGIQPGQEHLRAWLEYLRLNARGLVVSEGAGCLQGESYEALFIRIKDVCRTSAQECIKIGRQNLVSHNPYPKIQEDTNAHKPSEEGPANHRASDPALVAPAFNFAPESNLRKGDPRLIAGKRSVAFRTAELYLGIGERQRQKLMEQKLLTTEGEGSNRKITTSSLRAYLPSEENPH